MTMQQQDLIAQFIEISAVMGINDQTLALAAQRAKKTDELYKFWGKATNFVHHLELRITREAIKRADLDAKSISGRIQDLLWNRLMIYTEFKNFRDFLKAKICFAVKPQNTLFATKQIWCIADNMWHAIKDSSTDFSFYTKRVTLCALYSAVLLKFISDWSHDFKDTKSFLQNRIKNITSFAQFKFRMRVMKEGQF